MVEMPSVQVLLEWLVLVTVTTIHGLTVSVMRKKFADFDYCLTGGSVATTKRYYS